MPMIPTYVIKGGLLQLWQHWGKHLRQYYLPSYAIPPKPPLPLLQFTNTIRSNINGRKNMLLKLDRQVEAKWRFNGVKDDDRIQAASKVIPVWEARMKAHARVQVDKVAGRGLSINEGGRAFEQAADKPADAHIEVRKPRSGPENKGKQVMANAQAFIQYFRA